MPSARTTRLALLTTGFLWACATTTRPAAVPPPEAAQAPTPAGAALPPRGGPLAAVRPAPEPVRTVARLTIGAVGDVLMHEAVKRSAEVHGRGMPDGGYAWLYAPIADLLSEPDLTFANLETPIAPRAGAGVSAKEFFFNAPPAAVAALAHAGVDLVNVANNHVFDVGRAGFEETLAQLSALGMPYVGAGPEGHAAGPLVLERNGLRIAFLAWSYGFNQGGNDCPPARTAERACPQASRLDRARAVEEVRAAAASADAVIVSLHWGKEYEQQPFAEDVELAHRLADAGALVVLGHHPHVLQPIELYPRADGSVAVIAYSLGNFVSNQARLYVPGVTPEGAQTGAPRDGALVRVAIERRDYGRGVERVEVAGADWLPLWTENDTATLDPRRDAGRRPAIRVVAVDRALASVRARIAGFPDPTPPDRQAELVRLRREEANLVARRAAIGAVLGEALERTLGPAELAGPAPAANGAAAGGAPAVSPPAGAR